MDSTGTVTHWLEALHRGDHDAAERLWEAYYRRLVGLAHRNLGGVARGAADSEDVVLSAFDSFYRGVEGGRFPRMADRDDLWRVLVTLTVCKARNQVRKETAEKRGGGRPTNELSPALADDGPTPEMAAELVEELRRRLASLGDADLRAVAVAKMEGCTNAEIAARFDWSESRVERKLARIRQLWEESSNHG